MIGEPGDDGPGVASVGAPLPVVPLDGAPLVPASPDWPGLDTRRRALRGKQRPGTWALQGTISSFLEKALDPSVQRPSFLLTVSPLGKRLP